jgi:hypothetical protein
MPRSIIICQKYSTGTFKMRNCTAIVSTGTSIDNAAYFMPYFCGLFNDTVSSVLNDRMSNGKDMEGSSHS